MKRTVIAGLVSAVSGLALASQALAASDVGPALKTGHEYLIATSHPDQMHVVDVATDSIYKSCSLPGKLGPGTAMMAPDNKTAFVLNNRFGDIYGIDLDNCQTSFHARLSQAPGEMARSMFSFALSPDGKELYTTVNPTERLRDHYEVKQPRLDVYKVDDGVGAKPVRSFPMPRQVFLMRTAQDGSLYVAGPDIYKMDVNTGKYEVAVPTRNWDRPTYSAPDVLYFWPHQTVQNDFSMLYSAAKFADESQNMDTAEYVYGYVSIDLATGKSKVEDFGELVELYFTGLRSPKDNNQMFGVLNRFAKYDIKEKKLLEAAELEHTYYCLAFNKSGDKVYLGGTFNDIAVFDPDTMKKIKNIQLPGGDMSLATLQVFVR